MNKTTHNLFDKTNYSKPQTWLSLVRIPLAFLMFYFAFVNKWWFLGVLVFAGLTDFFDGIVARARGEQGPEGAWFDSFADHIFYPFLIASTVVLSTGVFKRFLIPSTILIVWYLVNLIIMRIRFGKTVFIHLNSVRFSVAAYFVFSILLVFDFYTSILFFIILIIYAIRMFDETICYSHMPKNKIYPDLRYSWNLF